MKISFFRSMFFEQITIIQLTGDNHVVENVWHILFYVYQIEINAEKSAKWLLWTTVKRIVPITIC